MKVLSTDGLSTLISIVKSTFIKKTDTITPDYIDIYSKDETDTLIEDLDNKIDGLKRYKFPNAVIVGSPTLNDGQISNFSATSYLQFPSILDLHDQAFDIDMCFTTTNDVTTQQNVLDSKYGIALAIKDGKGLMAISSNGQSWDIGVSVGSIDIEPNTTYYAKLSWNKLQYKTFLSKDGKEYTEDMVLVGAIRPFPTTIYIGGCDKTATGHDTHPFLGIINMNYCLLTVMGNVVWEGMADAGLVTRADISLSNLDDEGEARFTAKQDVLTQGENISITTAEDGTVTISASDTTYSQGTGVTIDTNNQISVTDYNTIVSNASAGASAASTISGYGDIVTHNTTDFLSSDTSIPTNTSDLNNDSGYITNSVDNLTNYTKSDDLSAVATSGSYNDLSDTPTIPDEVTETTVSNWGFTKNIGTVTSVNNVSPTNGNVTIEIPTVPTNVSSFNNDSGYITSDYHDNTKQDALPEGTTGYYLQKTATGVDWAEVTPGTDVEEYTSDEVTTLWDSI